MSFGEGDLHAKVAQLKTERDSYKRQVDKLLDTNGDLCKEINRQDAEIRKQYSEIQKLKADNDELREMYVLGMTAKDERIEKLESLVSDMFMNFGCPESHPCQRCMSQLDVCDVPKRVKELGIEACL